MSISITPSPFGSITVTLDGELGGVLSASILATSNSALNLDLGVPGPKGDTGDTGPAGENGTNGTNGVGVPVGGTTGQALVKLSGTNYDTGWTTINSATWGSITGTLSNQTDLQNALDGKLSLSGGTMATNASVNFSSNVYPETPFLNFVVNVPDEADFGGYIRGDGFRFYDNIGGSSIDAGYYNGFTHASFDNENVINVSYNGITFPDTSVQTTAGLPLTGGTMTGNLSIYDPNSSPIEILSTSGDGIAIINHDTNESFTLSYGGITFKDSTTQTTAFIPSAYLSTASAVANYQTLAGMSAYLSTSAAASNYFAKPTGTTGQYIRGDGSLATYSTGDKYLTTSTTSLSISNGLKTLTIGTGLSYSTQQDVTIAYDASNHMHATVTSYNSGTGVMVADVYNKTGSGTYSSWTVNVGGVQGGSYLQIANNLSDLNSSSTARTNLGLGSLATLSSINNSNWSGTALSVANGGTGSTTASDARTALGLGTASTLASTAVAQTANNLSDLANAGTARTNLGLGTASTSPATAFLQTANNLSDVTASTARTNLGLTSLATASFATMSEAQAGSSTTTVISPSTLLDAKYFGGGKFLTGITWSTATSGTGASAGANGINARVATAPTSATGYAQNHGNVLNNVRGGAYNNGIDWSKRVVFGGRINRNTTTPDSNSAFRFSLGRFVSQVPSDILSTDKQVGIKVSGSGAIVLYAGNGSALSTVTSSFTPSNSSAYDVVIISDGAGNVTLYVNGSSVATSTGGPTSSQGTNYSTISFETQNSTTLTNGNMVAFLTDAFVQVNV